MTNDLHTVVSAMDSVFSHQDSSTGWLWQPLLRLLARGEPVTIAEVAAATGRPGEDVAQAVDRLGDTEYDDLGRIVGYGITLRPTPHRFTVDGTPLYTWCALDTLIFPAILDRSAQVESPCHTTGDPIRLTVEPDRVTDVEPETAVVSIVTPNDLASVRASFCNHVHFFTDTAAAQPWLSEHPGGSVLPVADAYQLGRELDAAQDDTAEPGGCC
ncbi:organomercurial lyase MerB [Amycolatopsis ultiminotia]|uniref:Alkylmercury lyase n=1 Tax=Amycolatopsis ultiminotia TaxID=543629 RepID=A0ABP6XWW9_9PSEU